MRKYKKLIAFLAIVLLASNILLAQISASSKDKVCLPTILNNNCNVALNPFPYDSKATPELGIHNTGNAVCPLDIGGGNEHDTKVAKARCWDYVGLVSPLQSKVYINWEYNGIQGSLPVIENAYDPDVAIFSVNGQTYIIVVYENLITQRVMAVQYIWIGNGFDNGIDMLWGGHVVDYVQHNPNIDADKFGNFVIVCSEETPHQIGSLEYWSYVLLGVGKIDRFISRPGDNYITYPIDDGSFHKDIYPDVSINFNEYRNQNTIPIYLVTYEHSAVAANGTETPSYDIVEYMNYSSLDDAAIILGYNLFNSDFKGKPRITGRKSLNSPDGSTEYQYLAVKGQLKNETLNIAPTNLNKIKLMWYSTTRDPNLLNNYMLTTNSRDETIYEPVVASCLGAFRDNQPANAQGDYIISYTSINRDENNHSHDVVMKQVEVNSNQPPTFLYPQPTADYVLVNTGDACLPEYKQEGIQIIPSINGYTLAPDAPGHYKTHIDFCFWDASHSFVANKRLIVSPSTYNLDQIWQRSVITIKTPLQNIEITDSKFNFYPNPFVKDGIFTYALEKNEIAYSVNINDNTGRLISTINIPKGSMSVKYSLPLNNLSKGMYIAVLRTNKASYSLKLISK